MWPTSLGGYETCIDGVSYIRMTRFRTLEAALYAQADIGRFRTKKYMKQFKIVRVTSRPTPRNSSEQRQ